MKKNNSRKVIFSVGLIVLLSIIWLCTSLYFGFKVEDFRTQVLYHLSENVTDIQCIPYEYLDEKYKHMVSKEQYTEATSLNEIVAILQLFNGVPHVVEATTQITTDGFKTYPIGIVEIDGQKFEIEHHIDFSIKNFKPCVVKWYVDINRKG